MPKTSTFVKFVAHPGQRGALVDALRAVMPTAQDEAGTEMYSVHIDRSDDNALWMFELYRDDDALTEHSSTDALKGLLTSLPPLLAEPPLMVFATPIEAKGFDV